MKAKHTEKEIKYKNFTKRGLREMAVRSPLRYPGGKWKALDTILPLVPTDIDEWREPFFGGGSVTMGLIQLSLARPKRMLVGDLAPEVYNFWIGTQRNPAKVEEFARHLYETHKDPDELWKYMQEIDCTQLNEFERAGRFFLVNRISFSGMGDSGTLSRMQYDEFKYDHFKVLYEASRVIKDVEIRNCSYEEILFEPMKYGADKTFIFLDPPYETQAKSALYGRNGDTHISFPHDKFAEDCKKLECKFLITYDDCNSIRRRFKWATIRPFHIQYTMAGVRSKDALDGEELLIANYDINTEDEEVDGLF